VKTNPNKIPMKEQSPEIRKRNFFEVALGYTPEEAVEEAQRCLQCKNAPCVKGCPVGIDIPTFISLIREKKFTEALEKIRETNLLPAICGRVCPQEKQCEAHCTLGKIKGYEPVAIGRLERFAADWEIQNKTLNIPEIQERKNRKIAIVGSGPAGLACASYLAKKGYRVVIFEALHEFGGVLTYGIPEFRLPKSIVAREIETIRTLGVKLVKDTVVGRTITFEELRKDFDAIFIATGAGAPKFLGIKGTNLIGIFSANEFLTRINLMKAYKFPEYDTPVLRGERVIVVGAGNVAMDAARSALRTGAKEVTVIYRRTEKEMPARIEEYHHAVEEGVKFIWLATPIEYLGDDIGKLKKVKCIRMSLAEPDESGRRRPVPVENSEFLLDADLVIEAIGQGPNKVLLNAISDLELNSRGYIKVDPETMQTNIPGVYAGGDIVTGAATVIEAMGAGKRAALAIDHFLANINSKSR